MSDNMATYLKVDTHELILSADIISARLDFYQNQTYNSSVVWVVFMHDFDVR